MGTVSGYSAQGVGGGLEVEQRAALHLGHEAQGAWGW